MLRLFGLAVFVLALALSTTQLATAQGPRLPEELDNAGGLTPPPQLGEDIPAPEAQARGSFTNLSDIPFRYRLRRCRGACWTEEHTIAPGESRNVLEGLDREDILGVGRGVGVPFIVVQYPQEPGYIRLKLTGRTGPEKEIFMPFYFFVIDNNGFGRLLHAADETAARKQYAQLLEEPKLDAQGRRDLYEQAIASGVLHIPTTNPPIWEWPPIGTGAIRADALIDGPVFFQGLPPGPTFIGPWYYFQGYRIFLW